MITTKQEDKIKQLTRTKRYHQQNEHFFPGNANKKQRKRQ